MAKVEQKERSAPAPSTGEIPAPQPSAPPKPSSFFKRCDWLAFGITYVIAQVFYVLTQAPTVTLEDSGELITGAANLGVPHPPGYPLWTILGWIFTRIFSFVRYWGHPNPAWAVNCMSGFFGALCCATVALLISHSGRDLLRTFRHEDDPESATPMEKIMSWASGLAAGLILAFCPFIWSQCVIAEVYGLNTFLHVLILTLAYVWLRRPHEDRLLYWIAALFGLTFTNCQPIVLMMPGLMMIVWAADRRLFRDCLAAVLAVIGAVVLLQIAFPEYSFGQLVPQEFGIPVGIVLILSPFILWIFTRQIFSEWKRVVPMILFVLLGLSLFVYMPISSDFNPPINWGYPRTFEGFRHAVTRGQYQALAPALDPRAFVIQIVEFLSELEDQFPFPIPLLALVPIFFFRHIWRRHWSWLLGTIIAFMVTGPGMMIILNPPHDLQSLFIAQVQFCQSTAIYAIWVGYGFLFCLAFLERFFRRRIVLALALAITLLSPLGGIWQNWYDEKMIADNGGTELCGHDFGWQFGNYQLCGAEAITRELKPGEPRLPNPAYPPAMTTNAVFYGGTDPGRFVPTYMIFCPKVRADVMLITQNALADNTYMAVMRDLYGDLIWIPTPQDTNLAFQSYINDVRTGRIPSNAAVTIDPGGKVSVQGVQGVMEINGIISKAIFEANKRRHDFYVEESYVINWMYPYLSPHGLIMKINKEPLPKLTDEMVKNDMDFWAWYFNHLMKDRKFQRDVVARKTFSKLRCAIAGLYVYRRMMNKAEIAFRQAVDLYPASPEANFRLADMYLQTGRLADALKLMETNQTNDPNNDRITGFIGQIKDMTQMNNRVNQLQAQLSKGSCTLDMVFELTTIYQRTGHEQQFQDMSMQILNNTNTPSSAYLKVAELASNPPRWPLIAEAYQRYLQREKSDPRIWLELACAQTHLGQNDRAIQSLHQAITCGGEPLKDAIRKDPRFDPLRSMEGFQKLLVQSAQQPFAPLPGLLGP
jgi:tetratricopeptide (TPR) repeat protein